jgi:protein-S-isoprenylcysteine O-methyltransferase Ste14
MLKNEQILVFLQFVCFSLLWYLNGFYSVNYLLLFIQITAVFIGFWSIFELSKGKISIFPSVKNGAVLIQSGPFKLVRHPIYSCVLIYFSSFLLEEISIFSFMFNILLFVVIISKINLEESLLKAHFENYNNYQEKTFKLIPYIY